MTKLADVEEIRFRPRAGRFDVEAVAAAIVPLGFSYRDPHATNMFLIFDNPESRERCLETRTNDPGASLPYELMFIVDPDEIHISQFAGPRDGDAARSFVAWLLATYPCRVFNDVGGAEITDLTLDP